MGLGFIHLGFLAAGAAVAVPIVIHLLFRQRARRVELGTLQFLRVALRDHAHRRKIRRWILLALRSAGVLLLALLFARPYWNARGELGREREVVLLIDRSASMAAGGPGASPFDKAERQAGEVLQDMPAGAAVHLAYFDAGGVAPARAARIDPAAVPNLSGTDYTQALGWARDIVVGSRRLNRQVFLWTDLQRCGLGSPSGERFPPGADVEIIDVGRSLTRNLAVEEVQAERTDLQDGKPVVVAARVFNAGLFPARDVRVKLSLEGMPAIEQTLTVEGHARRLVRFEVPIREPGLYHGYVEAAAEDDLPFDNRRWLAFEARPTERVLLVDGEPGTSVFGNETYYLETALRLALPGHDPNASATPYVPEHLAWNGRSGSLPGLGRFRIVALCNVPDLAPADAGALEGFVTGGGTLIIFTGDRVKPGAYAALQEANVMPGRLGEPAEDGPYRFAGWEKDHPVLAPFTDPLHGDLRTLRFRRITRVAPDPLARVLATAQGGSPLLVERSHGAGKCLLFAFPADNAWGEWAIHRLYLPLVHQLVGYATGRLPETGPVKFARAGQGPNQAPGVAIDNGHALVRNVDPAESEIERTTVATLREVYRLPEANDNKPRAQQATATLAAGEERPDELWRSIAWGLLIVLVAETFVANRTYA
ncbi:MAG: BatA domain-containing protein [Isosphaerales bacterium]